MYTYPILTTTTTTTATFTPETLEKNSISFQSFKEGFCRNNCIFYIYVQVMDMLMTLNREQRWPLPSLWDPAGAELSVCVSGGRGKLRSTWTPSPAACHNWQHPSASPPATWPRTAAAVGGRSGVDMTGGAPNLDEGWNMNVWMYERNIKLLVVGEWGTSSGWQRCIAIPWLHSWSQAGVISQTIWLHWR